MISSVHSRYGARQSQQARCTRSVPMRRHDGEYRIVLDKGVPVIRDDGQILEWVGTCIDITDRKEGWRKSSVKVSSVSGQ